MPQNRLLAIFDHFLHSLTQETLLTPVSPDDEQVMTPVARSLLDALEKHLGPEDTISPRDSTFREAPLRLQNQVLARTVTMSGAIANALVRLGVQATTAADWKLPSSISVLLQAIGRNLGVIANSDGIADQSMLRTCVFLSCFIAEKYVPKEDEQDIRQNLRVILEELLRVSSAQQPPNLPTVSPPSPSGAVSGYLGPIRNAYLNRSRSPSVSHSQLSPNSPHNQNSTLSTSSVSSDPPSNEPHSSVVETSPSTDEPPQSAVVDPSNVTRTENGQSNLPFSSTTSDDNSTAGLGIFFPVS
jgi:hypothetical protein